MSDTPLTDAECSYYEQTSLYPTGMSEEKFRAEISRQAREANRLERRCARLEAALRFYGEKNHFALAEPDAWDTVSGEPTNLWCDDAGTATVEDGWVARDALEGK